MKRSIFFIVLLGLVLGFGFGPGCTSFVWDPTGVWTFIYFDFSEEVTLSGSCEEGIISNWVGDGYDPQTGTWTKTADFTIDLRIDFISQWGTHVVLTITFTSSKDSPNTMSGNAWFVEDSYEEEYTIQASKVTNLQ